MATWPRRSTTYTGTVTAASNWGAPPERKRVRSGLKGSYEELFHNTGLPRFLLSLRDDGQVVKALRERRLERAIGVIYLPATERMSHLRSCTSQDKPVGRNNQCKK
ncbi:MAG TPA: erythromycin esterase family protein [Allocoleopsis sp.]